MPSASAPSTSIPVRASPPSTGQRSPSERISRSASSAPGRSAASSSTSAPPRRMRERYGSSEAVAGREGAGFGPHPPPPAKTAPEPPGPPPPAIPLGGGDARPPSPARFPAEA